MDEEKTIVFVAFERMQDGTAFLEGIYSTFQLAYARVAEFPYGGYTDFYTLDESS